MQKLSTSVHWSCYFNNMKSEPSQNLILRNQQRKFSSKCSATSGCRFKTRSSDIYKHFLYIYKHRPIQKRSCNVILLKTPYLRQEKLPLKTSHNEKVAQQPSHSFQKAGSHHSSAGFLVLFPALTCSCTVQLFFFFTCKNAFFIT